MWIDPEFLDDQPLDVREAATEVMDWSTGDGDHEIFEVAGKMIADLRRQFREATGTEPKPFQHWSDDDASV
jgi:hypothetical protein